MILSLHLLKNKCFRQLCPWLGRGIIYKVPHKCKLSYSALYLSLSHWFASYTNSKCRRMCSYAYYMHASALDRMCIYMLANVVALLSSWAPAVFAGHSHCSIAETHGLHSVHRTWCDNRSRDGRIHQQTLSYDRFHMSGHRLCARPGNALLPLRFFSLAPCSFQTVDAISWAKEMRG